MVEHKIFAEGVIKDIKKYLSPDYADVECEVIEKRSNNGQLSVNIAFTQPEREITPIIGIEPFYEAVRNGESLESIMQVIAEMAEQTINTTFSITPGEMNEYKEAENYLGVCLVNTKANRKQLKGVTCIKVEDLSLIPIIRVPLSEKGIYGSMKVTEELREMWGVSVEQIFEQAWKNEESPMLLGLNEAVLHTGDMRDLSAAQDLVDNDNGEKMYILTNKRRIDGAALIVYPGVKEKLDELFPEGFFIVPSSIHETLIMPKGVEIQGLEMTPKELGRMLRYSNQRYVDKMEFLSDRIYEYDKDSGKIRQVSESMEKERGMEL